MRSRSAQSLPPRTLTAQSLRTWLTTLMAHLLVLGVIVSMICYIRLAFSLELRHMLFALTSRPIVASRISSTTMLHSSVAKNLSRKLFQFRIQITRLPSTRYPTKTIFHHILMYLEGPRYIFLRLILLLKADELVNRFLSQRNYMIPMLNRAYLILTIP